MSSVSRAQQQFMAIAEHEPGKLRGPKPAMTHQQLHDFAATKTKGLPMHAPKKMALGGLVSGATGGGMMAGDAPIVAALKRGLAQRAAMRGPRMPNALGRGFGAPAGGMMPGRPMMMAGGGSVPGRGAGDSVPAKLTPGEFVVKKSAAKKNLGALKKINAGKAAMKGDEPESRADRIKEFETAHGEKEI